MDNYDYHCHQDCGPGFETAVRVNKTGTHMRALAVNPSVNGVPSADRYTIYTNITLAKMYDLKPAGTSCVFIEFALYTDLEAKLPYSHR